MGAAAAGFAASGDWPKTIVAPPSGSALGAGFAAPVFKLPVWNIIVRPAPSSVGAVAAGLAGAAAGLAAAAGGRAAGAGIAGFAIAGDCPNTIVAFGAGSAALGAGFGAAGAGLGAGAAAGTGFCCSGTAPAGMTLNVFWHFPQRMVRPWGPIRASSTR